MALQFVLGSSGSGKTQYIYERLVRQAGEHPKKNYLVIVPEQFTMQTQQKLVELAPNHAIMNIDVLSFKRLAYRVFDDMGMHRAVSNIPSLPHTSFTRTMGVVYSELFNSYQFHPSYAGSGRSVHRILHDCCSDRGRLLSYN